MKFIPIRLFDVKKKEDQINEGQEQISFIQVFLNTLLFTIFSKPRLDDDDPEPKNVYKGLLPIFFNLNEINNSNPYYYILQKFNHEVDVMIA